MGHGFDPDSVQDTLNFSATHEHLVSAPDLSNSPATYLRRSLIDPLPHLESLSEE
jgi:hypothetical protein